MSPLGCFDIGAYCIWWNNIKCQQVLGAALLQNKVDTKHCFVDTKTFKVLHAWKLPNMTILDLRFMGPRKSCTIPPNFPPWIACKSPRNVHQWASFCRVCRDNRHRSWHVLSVFVIRFLALIPRPPHQQSLDCEQSLECSQRVSENRLGQANHPIQDLVRKHFSGQTWLGSLEIQDVCSSCADALVRSFEVSCLLSASPA